MEAQPILGEKLTLSSLWKEKLATHKVWAVYQCHDLSSPRVGQISLVAIGPDCANKTPPATASHWSFLFVGMLDLDKMELKGNKTHPVEFIDEEEVWLIYDAESGPERTALSPQQLYRIRVRARTTASRGKGWTVQEVRGLEELRAAVAVAREKYPASSHEVMPEAGFEKGARMVWHRVKI